MFAGPLLALAGSMISGETVALELDSLSGRGADAAVAGEFLEDRRMHLAIAAQGRLILRFGPDAFRATEVVAGAQTGVRDVARLPISGRDAILSIGSGGLQLHRFNESSSSFNTQTLAAGAWRDGKELCVEDFNLDGHLDVACVAGDGTSVAILLGSLSGWISGGSYTLGAPIDRLLSIDWLPGQPGSELLAVQGSVLTFANLNTLWTGAFASLVPIHDAVRFHEASAPGDALALLLDMPGGSQRLVTFGTQRIWSGFDLGSVPVTDMVARDVDGDGADELFLQRGDGVSVERYDHPGAGQGGPWEPFASAPVRETPFGPKPPKGSAPGPLVVSDFDGDGDLDLWFQRTGNAIGYLARGHRVDEVQLKPELPYISFHADPQAGDVACLAFTLFPTPPPFASHLEVTVWRGDQVTTEDTPVQALRFDLAPILFQGSFEFRLPETSTTFDTHYGLVVRYVQCVPGLGLGDVGLDAVFTIEGHSGVGSTGHNPRPPLPIMPRVPDSIDFGSH